MFPGALRRDILGWLVIKVVLLAALYLVFFSQAQQPVPDAMLTHILGR